MHLDAYKHLRKRASDDNTIVVISGVATASSVATTGTSLVLDTDASTSVSVSAYAIASASITITTPASSTAAPIATTSSVSASASSTSDAASSSDLSIGAVIGVCVGVFAGVLILALLAYHLYKRSLARTALEREESWKKLGDEPEMRNRVRDSAHVLAEKNSRMFKKSTPSTRTTRTTPSDDDGGFAIPPFEFSKYHPNLAQELALKQPARPFAGEGAKQQREDSGVSWDSPTLTNDSFLSMHSKRIDSGAQSPSLVMAKMTPAASAAQVQQWESAEVLTMEADPENVAGPEEVQNPFVDSTDQRRSVANPFFNARDMQRSGTLSRNRSRSNSRTSRTRSTVGSLSRRDSTATAATVRQSELPANPFADIQEVPVYRVSPPALQYNHTDSIASGSSGAAFGERAMKSLIAALDLTQEEVEERLRVVSMNGSTMSSLVSQDEEVDIATADAFPMPPDNTRNV